MIKASATGKDGRTIVILGLSHANLDKLRADGTNGFIKVIGNDIDIGDIDIIITAGETEAHLTEVLGEFIGPETKTVVAKRLKQ